MDSVKPSAVSFKKSKLARTFAKVLHIRMLTGISPAGEIQKVHRDTIKSGGDQSDSFDYSDDDDEEEELQEKAAMEALLAKLFANIAALKAAYAQLQFSQSPFNADGIQAADRTIVVELKSLSELKRCFVKKQFDPSPETAMLSAEIVEQKSVLKIYEISMKKLNSQVRLKDSEIIFLKEKLVEAKNGNKLLEKRLNHQSGQLFMMENLHLSGLNSNHFSRVLRHTIKSIRSFVQLLINEMTTAGWDISTAASAIEPDVVYWKEEHQCFAFEAFVCRVMFESFHYPNFALPNESLPEKQQQKKLYFERFTELQSSKSKEFLAKNPKSTFGKLCRVKYLQLIHPRMESSFFGNMRQRSLVDSGQIPDTAFFGTFGEMAKWVWLLHCLAFSMEPEASIFQVNRGCRFTEVYMRSMVEEGFSHCMESDPQVAFTVIPGFNVGKTVIQCQVYLSQSKKHHEKKAVQRKQR